MGGSRALFADIHPKAKHDPESQGVLLACRSRQFRVVSVCSFFGFVLPFFFFFKKNKTSQNKVGYFFLIVMLTVLHGFLEVWDLTLL